MNGPTESTPPPVEWTVRPLEERPLAGVVAILVIGLLGVLVWLAAGDWIWGVLSVLLLLATISRFLMRSRVAIGSEGIVAEFPLVTRRIPWERVARIRYDARAALVRTDRRHLLGREVTILFGPRQEDALRALRRWAPAGTLPASDGTDP